jgi:hypothetical protein
MRYYDVSVFFSFEEVQNQYVNEERHAQQDH